jgi:hypothetical protein
VIRRRPHSEVARHAQEGKTASLRSINLPQTGRGELQEISIRISKIDAVSAARPFRAALDPYFVPAQPRLPLRQVFSCYCEGDVQWAVTIVRRNRAARQAESCRPAGEWFRATRRVETGAARFAHRPKRPAGDRHEIGAEAREC